MYSSIDEADRVEVIDTCYYPLLELADSGIPIAVEIPGITLEIINDLRPAWVNKFRLQLADQRIELVGSGYSQIIGPLVPAEVNYWNQKIGLDLYQHLLGIRPEIALVNEMAYSAGIADIYHQAGYRGIIMEWNNPRKYHPEWSPEILYNPQTVRTAGHELILLIWSDSISFQKFQRYSHGDLEFSKLLNYLKEHSAPSDRFFPLYSNDVEIFDYRPGRYKTEADIGDGISEWQRIRILYEKLSSHPDFELVGLNRVLPTELTGDMVPIVLEDSIQPIPVKKQEKYNINRWALSGRADFNINTICHRLYKNLSKHDRLDSTSNWKQLCYLWSSDFRTHITEARWAAYLDQLTDFEKMIFERNGDDSDASVIHSETFDGSVIKHSADHIELDTSHVNLQLNPGRGNTIKSCVFRELDSKPLFGTIEHGYYEDISLSADFYSGHCIITPPAKHKITDLEPVEVEVTQQTGGIHLYSEFQEHQLSISTEISTDLDSVNITKKLRLPSRIPATIHPVHITLIPDSWDRDSLFFAVKNGGAEYEHFRLGRKPIQHRGLHSALISSLHSLGATDGKLFVGDKDKRLCFQHDPAVGAVLPGITYLPIGRENFFFRIIYSALELDETFREKNELQNIDVTINISSA